MDSNIDSDDEKQRLMLELIEAWEGMPMEAKGLAAYTVAFKKFQMMPKWKKAVLIGVSLLAGAAIVYITAQNWAVALVIGVLIGIIVGKLL